jgi:hypothetical protein
MTPCVSAWIFDLLRHSRLDGALRRFSSTSASAGRPLTTHESQHTVAESFYLRTLVWLCNSNVGKRTGVTGLPLPERQKYRKIEFLCMDSN